LQSETIPSDSKRESITRSKEEHLMSCANAYWSGKREKGEWKKSQNRKKKYYEEKIVFCEGGRGFTFK